MPSISQTWASGRSTPEAAATSGAGVKGFCQSRVIRRQATIASSSAPPGIQQATLDRQAAEVVRLGDIGGGNSISRAGYDTVGVRRGLVPSGWERERGREVFSWHNEKFQA